MCIANNRLHCALKILKIEEKEALLDNDFLIR